MRKLLILVFTAILTLSVAGCSKNMQDVPAVATNGATAPGKADDAPVYFPEGSYLGTLNFSGMTHSQALQILTDAVESYILTMHTQNEIVHIYASELKLTVNEDALSQWLETGAMPDDLLSYDINGIYEALFQAFGEPAKNATIRYNSDQGRFIAISEENGTGVDATQALEDGENAIRSLSPTVQTTITLYTTDPEITASSDLVTKAVSEASRYLRPQLKYIYNIPGSKSITASIKQWELASFVAVGEDLSVSIDQKAVKSYISKMAGKYGGDVTEGDLITYTGRAVTPTVEYYGTVLDQQAMYEDLIYCLENGVSGSRMNEYIPCATHLPYGGNYVEIDLQEQKLYVLQDGEVIVSTDVVSGDIITDDWTENGVFSIYNKKTNCWLTGPTWRDFVSYWIAFDGNIGMHDASWRTDFGGSIFKYSGSHGCINMPVDITGEIYANVSLGTRVIVHSSVGYSQKLQQEITGTACYTVTDRDSAFLLDAGLKYAGVALTYTSSDTSVATVNELGVVTPVGAGTAQIIVKAEGVGPLSGAELVIDITVNPWQQTASPVVGRLWESKKEV